MKPSVAGGRFPSFSEAKRSEEREVRPVLRWIGTKLKEKGRERKVTRW